MESYAALMTAVLTCAIVVMSIACCILWMNLARIKERSLAQEAKIKELEAQDSVEITKSLLGKLSTMPIHKKQTIMTWVKQYKPKAWYEKQVHYD